eukprot:TRINITY_DN177_c1_g1_i7.p2 TRINITY_DN177_c1_g1~~TRINITY_DN177_c1_g1_i7.p2  ORF type:complete len:251 (-),score=52.29 TRINITY_DN177_c1_g1_i7:1963-2715(-)
MVVQSKPMSRSQLEQEQLADENRKKQEAKDKRNAKRREKRKLEKEAKLRAAAEKKAMGITDVPEEIDDDEEQEEEEERLDVRTKKGRVRFTTEELVVKDKIRRQERTDESKSCKRMRVTRELLVDIAGKIEKLGEKGDASLLGLLDDVRIANNKLESKARNKIPTGDLADARVDITKLAAELKKEAKPCGCIHQHDATEMPSCQKYHAHDWNYPNQSNKRIQVPNSPNRGAHVDRQQWNHQGSMVQETWI